MRAIFYYGAPIVIPSGHAHIVLFCRDWRIRYPKNPKENFKDNKDKNLFVGLDAVTISGHRLELEARGAFRALEKIKHLMIELPETFREFKEFKEIKLIDAINLVWEEWKGIQELGRKSKDDGEITFVVNANRLLDEITAPINGYLKSVARRSAPKVRNLFNMAPKDCEGNAPDKLRQWELMIEIWDLMQDESDERSYPKIVEELQERHGCNYGTKEVERMYKKIDHIIRECTSRKWPGPVFKKR